MPLMATSSEKSLTFVRAVEAHRTDAEVRAGGRLKNPRIVPPVPECENGDSVLTESPFVRELDEKAPPVGLERRALARAFR
jgi:hypothetical protein